MIHAREILEEIFNYWEDPSLKNKYKSFENLTQTELDTSKHQYILQHPYIDDQTKIRSRIALMNKKRRRSFLQRLHIADIRDKENNRTMSSKNTPTHLQAQSNIIKIPNETNIASER